MEISRHWRLRKQRYLLQGNICPKCETKIFPPKGVCPECERRRMVNTELISLFVKRRVRQPSNTEN